MQVLFIGDVVGRSGRNALAGVLPGLKSQDSWDLCIANAENAAGGKGITEKVARELLDLGIDVLTMGNHTWDNKDIFNFIDSADYLVRPANYPAPVPGQGWTVVRRADKSVGIINLSGQVFMGPMECPFAAVDRILDELNHCQYIIIDFHAEATAEKLAFAHYVDGRVSAVVGTHTHIQTADAGVLPQGTLYITDVGATAPINSVLGMEIEPVIKRFTTKLPQRFSAASGPAAVCALWMDLEARLVKPLTVTSP